MTKVIDGNQIAKSVDQELQVHIAQFKTDTGITPKLVNIGYKPDERSLRYIKMKGPRAQAVGIDYEYLDLSDQSQYECMNTVSRLAQDKSIHGIIVQLPMHDWYDPQLLLNLIPPSKDVDGLSNQSLMQLQDNTTEILPATPLAILELLKRASVDMKDKQILIIGQGKLVGLPLKHILHNMGMQPIVADAQTADLQSLSTQADIIISATGQPQLITGQMIQEGAVVIDAGIVEVDGKPRGDVDFDSVSSKASIISPVPGGVGPVTVSMLLSNVLTAAKNSL